MLLDKSARYLKTELEELKGENTIMAEGFVIEANLDPQRGISAALVIKNGTLKSGMSIVSGKSKAPVRIMENFRGTPIKEAGFSEPINIVGWSELPEVGAKFVAYKNKKEAEQAVQKFVEEPSKEKEVEIKQVDAPAPGRLGGGDDGAGGPRPAHPDLLHHRLGRSPPHPARSAQVCSFSPHFLLCISNF